ncbi:MAG: Uma2 family endonuclease, partial [Chloroflexota bacterium]
MALPKANPPITEAEMLEVLSQERYRHLEIVDGQWVGEAEPPMTGEEHGAIAADLQAVMHMYAKQNKLGKVYPADVIFVLSGENAAVRVVRKPDIAFVKSEHVKTENRDKPYYRAPDLAIEIVSPSESAAETREKLNDYLTYGTRQVWVIYPKTQQVEVYLVDGTSK